MIVARFDELYLWESTPRVRVLQEVLSELCKSASSFTPTSRS
jgi:hypothetical protein